jgi:hypothetical protein
MPLLERHDWIEAGVLPSPRRTKHERTAHPSAVGSRRALLQNTWCRGATTAGLPSLC